MARPAYWIWFGLAGGLIIPAAAEEPVVFRTDVSLVRVDATVLDYGSRALTTLREEDFLLREEGRPQPIRNFSREEMPVDVLLLLDVSGSMRPHVQRVADAAQSALEVLGRNDRVAIMVFDRATRLRLPFRASRRVVQQGLEELLAEEDFNGGTDITRALYDAVQFVAREARPDARRAIVILTDDQTEFRRDEAGVGRALARAETVLSALIAPDAMGFGRGAPGGAWPSGPLGGVIFGRRGRFPGGMGSRTHPAGTEEIARRSGGDSLRVEDASALETTLSRIRQRYALYFQVPEGARAGQERTIEVDLAANARRRYPNAEVRYRRMYVVPQGFMPPVQGEAPLVSENRTEPAEAAGGEGAAAEPDRPVLIRRRPAPDAGGEPVILRPTPAENYPRATGSASPASSPPSQPGWRRVGEPRQEPAGNQKETGADPPSNTGGWRPVGSAPPP
jgi:VWFA-related protein